MNIYLRELKANKKSLLIWIIVMVLFVMMGMQKYDSMIVVGNGEDFLKLIESMPKFMQAIWGVSILDISSPMGYYGAIYFYLSLMVAIHAGMLGANIISKEERDKTTDFLMVKPITREKIMTSKIIAALTNVFILNIVIFLSSYFILKGLTNEPIFRDLIILMVGMLLIALIFLSIGVGIASIIKNSKKSVMITTSILLFSFFLSIIIDINEKFELLSFLTPLKYYDAKELMINYNINIIYLLLTIIIISSFIIIGYKKYKKRDLII